MPGSRKLPPIIYLVVAALIFFTVVSIVGLIVTFSQQGQINRNTEDLRIQQRELRTQARDRVGQGNRRSWRLCSRGNLTRAEIHKVADETGSESLAKLQQRLPLVGCEPNLRGKQARRLTSAEQRAFLTRYERGLIDPMPGER